MLILAKDCAEFVAAVVFGAASVVLTATGAAAAATVTAAVPALVGAGVLGGLAVAACQKHGVESQRALDAIRKRLERDWSKNSELAGCEIADLKKASEELHWSLCKCMLDRQALARTVTDRRTFPVAASDLVMTELGRCNGIFLPEGAEDVAPDVPNATARKFARAVIQVAFEAAMENENWFRKFEPYALLEVARTSGETLWVVKDIAKQIDDLKGSIQDLPEIVVAKVQSDFASLTELIYDFKRELSQSTELRRVLNVIEERRKTWVSRISDNQRKFLSAIPVSSTPLDSLWQVAQQIIPDCGYKEFRFRLHELEWLGLVERRRDTGTWQYRRVGG